MTPSGITASPLVLPATEKAPRVLTEIGHFALILALIVAALQTVLPAIAANADPAVLERLMTEGDYHGMATFDQALFRLYNDDYISMDEALERVTNPEDFRILVQQSGLSSVH